MPRDLLLRDPAGDGEDLDTAGRSAQWVRQGLIEIFCRFDADNDGILSCDELNSLRAELGSPAPPLTLSQFDCMCREHGLKRSRGGLSIDGFLDMYECTGRAAALADLEALGSKPCMLCRGMREQSVVDDEDEAELVRRLPHARVERMLESGHSVQGDQPVELAALLSAFVGDR